MEERFASPELVEASVKKRLGDIPKIGNRENKKLYDISDIVSEIESLKDSDQYRSLFSYFDTSSGVTLLFANSHTTYKRNGPVGLWIINCHMEFLIPPFLSSPSLSEIWRK